MARFNDGVEDIKDLREGMVLEGTVSNVAAFGAFVDLGVHQDGLVHVSQLAHKFVNDAREVVKTGDIVKVKVRGSGRGAQAHRADHEAGRCARAARRSAGQPLRRRRARAAGAPEPAGQYHRDGGRLRQAAGPEEIGDAALRIYAGPKARQHIEQQGLQPQAVGVVPGAAGGPKG